MAINASQESCSSIHPVRLEKLAMYRVDHKIADLMRTSFLLAGTFYH